MKKYANPKNLARFAARLSHMPPEEAAKCMPDFRALVDQRRTELGWSINAMAGHAGVPQRTLADWITSETPSINSLHLEKLLAVLGIRAW